jgi:hypothetical protein
MKIKFLKKRLLFNFLLLPLGLSCSILFTLLLEFIETVIFKTASGSDQLVPNIFDGLLSFIIGVIAFLGFLFWWSKRILSDIKRFKKMRPFVVMSLVILLLPYSPAIGFGVHTISSELTYYFQRKKMSHEVNSYSMLKPKNVRRIICSFIQKDSLLLVTAASDFKVSNHSKRIRLNGKHIYDDEIQLFLLDENRLTTLTQFSVDTTNVNGHLSWNIPMLPKLECNNLVSENHQLILESSCHHFTGVIEGFQKEKRVNSPKRGTKYLARKDSFWHLFYTEAHGTKLTKLHIAEFGLSTQKVHIVDLEDGDEELFDEDQIIALFERDGTFYIIADTAILMFTL